MTILELAASIKTMNRPDQTWPGLIVTLFYSLFFEQYSRLGHKILAQSSFKSYIFTIIILNQYLLYFGNCALVDNIAISAIFNRYFFHNFRLKWKFQCLMVLSDKYRKLRKKLESFPLLYSK